MLKQAPKNSNLLPTLAVTIGAAIWGIYWLPLRYIEQLGMSGVWAVVLANLVPLVLLIPLSLRCRHQITSDFRTLVLIGLFAGGAVTFYSIGLLYTTVVRATLLFYMTPVWSTLIGMAFLQEQVRWNRWAAITVGLLGLYFIVGGGGTTSEPLNIGDWFGIASGISWGIGAVLIKRNPEVSVTGMVTMQHASSALLALLCCFLLPGIGDLPKLTIWIDAIPIMTVYTWFGLVPSLFAIFWASSKLFPGRIGILMMTEAVVAVISASLLLDEQVLALEWLGVILILTAGVLEVISGDSGDHQDEAVISSDRNL